MSRDQRPIDEIAPAEFLREKWGTTDPEVAIELAERAPTSSDQVKACPECGSQRVKSKTKKKNGDHTKDGDYVCTQCRHHFSDPEYCEPARSYDLAVERFKWVDADDLADPPLRRQLPRLSDEAATALAIFLYRPWNHTDADPSYRDLATVLGYSRQWIGERVRAWRDNGAHRRLVRDPRPQVAIAEEVSADV